MNGINHNPAIWLQAADDAANSFLSQPPAQRESGNDNGYCKISVLSSLEALGDAVYYLNYPLYQFIKIHSNQWYSEGMTRQPEFSAAWAEWVRNHG
ncbi:hypothetical protein I1A41_16705 [Pectobacterium carotovorum]|uniref:Uncharacterized protein n=1 Tax=Pectobacterium aquaticum TaxID=2204145 RepID=A0A426JFU3_9GAMM|nr:MULTISPECIES: hypothetical protein [Pectobacterium]MCH4997840.1 hypothetical protein [Pectobacterium carotovorum]RRO12084.1 hypothetical protein DMB85_001345 [Pectobacterium aquaticum]